MQKKCKKVVKEIVWEEGKFLQRQWKEYIKQPTSLPTRRLWFTAKSIGSDRCVDTVKSFALLEFSCSLLVCRHNWRRATCQYQVGINHPCAANSMELRDDDHCDCRVEMPLLSEATQLKKFYTDHLVPRLIRIIPQRNQMVKLSEKVLKRQELLEEHYNILYNIL